MELYERLRSRGYRPWLDKKDLIGGQNWRDAIPKAIRASELFIACLSSHSVVKSGYVQKEFRLALNELVNKPSGQIYLIPLRLEACELPDIQLDEYDINFRNYHCIDYFEADGFERSGAIDRVSVWRAVVIPGRVNKPRRRGAPITATEADV